MKGPSTFRLFTHILGIQSILLLVCFMFIWKRAQWQPALPNPQHDQRTRGLFHPPTLSDNDWKGFTSEFLIGVHQWDYVKLRTDFIKNLDHRYFILNQLGRSSAPDTIKAQCFYEMSRVDYNEVADMWAWINGYIAKELANEPKFKDWFLNTVDKRIKSDSRNFKAYRETTAHYEEIARGHLRNVRQLYFKSGTSPESFLKQHQPYFLNAEQASVIQQATATE